MPGHGVFRNNGERLAYADEKLAMGRYGDAGPVYAKVLQMRISTEASDRAKRARAHVGMADCLARGKEPKALSELVPFFTKVHGHYVEGLRLGVDSGWIKQGDREHGRVGEAISSWGHRLEDARKAQVREGDARAFVAIGTEGDTRPVRLDPKRKHMPDAVGASPLPDRPGVEAESDFERVGSDSDSVVSVASSGLRRGRAGASAVRAGGPESGRPGTSVRSASVASESGVVVSSAPRSRVPVGAVLAAGRT